MKIRINVRSIHVTMVFFLAAAMLAENVNAFCRSAIIGKEATAEGRVINWWAFQWGWGHRLFVPSTTDRVEADCLFPLGPLHHTAHNNNRHGKIGNGVNEKGLFISCNVNNDMKDGRRTQAYHGARYFLTRCSTVSHMEQIIDEQTTFVRTGGDSGVMHWDTTVSYRYLAGAGDATGDSKFFEVTGDRYIPYKTRPEYSYVATRANNALDNVEGLGEGGGRSAKARDLLKAEAPNITLKYIKNTVCRANNDYGNASSMPMHMGVLPGEDPRLTTSVTALGEPYFSIFIPWRCGPSRE